MAAGLLIVLSAAALLTSFHSFGVYDSKHYDDWRRDFAVPYILSKEERHNILDWEILGPSERYSFLPDNRTIDDREYTRIRVSLDKDGDTVTYHFLAKVFPTEDGGGTEPYVILHRLEERLDQRFPPGIYDVAVYIPEN